MSKRKQRKNSIKQRNLYIAVGAAVLLVLVAAALLTTRSTTNAKENITPAEYQSQFIASNTSHLLLDVRTPEEFASGHIHGAVNIPVESLEDRLSEVPDDQPIVIYCRSGNRSAQASEILADAGYSGLYDLGGINTWTAQGYPVE